MSAADVSEKITIVLVDDNRLLSVLLQDALNRSDDVECVGVANTTDAARDLVLDRRPDILLVDLYLRDDDGIRLAGELLALHTAMRVIIFTNLDIGAAIELRLMAISRLSADAWDFLSARTSTDELLQSIRSVAQGARQPFLEQAAAGQLDWAAPVTPPGTPKPNLSQKESYVLKLLGRGLKTDEIRATRAEWADKEHAVESLMRNLRNKFGVQTQAQLVVEAQRLGYLARPDEIEPEQRRHDGDSTDECLRENDSGRKG